VGEGDKGKDAKTIAFLQDSAIVGDALNTWLPSARWQDSWPGYGEAIGVEVELVDQGKILPPLVERVGGHASVASISHVAWLVRPHVPASQSSVIIAPAFHLEGRGGGSPKEVRWEERVEQGLLLVKISSVSQDRLVTLAVTTPPP